AHADREGLHDRQRPHRHQCLPAGVRRPRLRPRVGDGAVRARQPHQHDLRGHQHDPVVGLVGPQGAGQQRRDAEEIRQAGGAAGGRRGREREDGGVHQPDRVPGRPDDQVHHRARLQRLPERRRSGRRRGGLPARGRAPGARVFLGAHGASRAARNRRRQYGPVLPGQAADRALLFRQAVSGNGNPDAHRAGRQQGADGDGTGAGLKETAMYKEHEARGGAEPAAISESAAAISRFQVKKVAVLGAGVMGAQIAAHLVNVKVPVVLFDLPAKEGPKNGIVTKAVEGLKKLKPSPLGVKDDAALIGQANYEEHLEQLKDCDLIIEAIAERMDWKLDLYRKIAPFVAPHAILASNTSGLSITKLSEALPEEMKPRFCGIHFFNPPRYMYLVELINTPTTDAHILDDLETFVTSGLGKGVVRAKDTPNFIANRVGIAGMLATMREVENFGLAYDVVDDLTGKKMGRASSGTFRTADIVGLDTMAHVIKTLQDTL